MVMAWSDLSRRTIARIDGQVRSRADAGDACHDGLQRLEEADPFQNRVHMIGEHAEMRVLAFAVMRRVMAVGLQQAGFLKRRDNAAIFLRTAVGTGS